VADGDEQAYTLTAEDFPNSVDGFCKWCQYLDEAYAADEENVFFDDGLLTALRIIPNSTNMFNGVIKRHKVFRHPS